jgi:hypothetical protein
MDLFVKINIINNFFKINETVRTYMRIYENYKCIQ